MDAILVLYLKTTRRDPVGSRRAACFDADDGCKQDGGVLLSVTWNANPIRTVVSYDTIQPMESRIKCA